MLCNKCGGKFPFINLADVIEVNEDNENIEEWKVCDQCHGDYFAFRNVIGGSYDKVMVRCERCGGYDFWQNMTNVDGEMVCRSVCAEHHKEDLDLYISIEWADHAQAPISWSHFWTMSHEVKERFK
ncbi:hypothetical protein KAR91_38715 [Candidatus Pacearchaeota archaeon]|nr:hypothetical protein [Candidatus Pacearchaeota archaeon]